MSDVKSKVTYKKTDRVRKTQTHVGLEEAVHGIQAVINAIAGSTVEVTISRSSEQKYARALFDVRFGDTVTLVGRTAEEIQATIAGIHIANQLRLVSQEARVLEEAA